MNKIKQLRKKMYSLLAQVNLFVRHHDLREHWINKANGLYSDHRFFRISYTDKHAGLFGIVDRVLGACIYAEERNLTPIVDLREEDIQYKNIDGTGSPWNVFFEPVSPYDNLELDKFSSTLFMGYNSKCPRFIRDEIFADSKSLHEAYEVYNRFLRLSSKAKERLVEEQKRVDLKRSLGVFLRGTDYLALKPSHHSIQPTVELAIPKIEEYLRDNKDTEYIYLVTEDRNIYEKMVHHFGDKVIMTGGRFVDGYDGAGLIADYIKDVNEQGFEYLVRIYMLSTCRALIGGPAAGASFARVLNDNLYEYVYIFELGRYE